MKNKHQKGFTLIELLVVIVILGIISTISVGTFRSYFAKARDAERVSAVTSIATMIKTATASEDGCGVYNVGQICTSCSDGPASFSVLFAEADYTPPETKSGFQYWYGFSEGTDAGLGTDNEFFVAVVSEEGLDSENATEIHLSGGGKAYIIVDGTANAIGAIDTVTGGTISASGYTMVAITTP